MEKHVTTINVVENNEESSDNNSNNITHTIADKRIKYVSEGVGWIGSILVLVPYVVPLNKTVDFILNTLGASGLFVVCVASKQYQSIIINAEWIVGGIYKYFS